MLFDDLKKANLMAMKNKDLAAKGILPVVINKVMLLGYEKKAKGETLEDSDVLQLIQKTLKELDEEIHAFEEAKRDEKVEELNKQKAVLSGYLPKQLTEEEIKAEIAKLEDKTLPSIMKHFKTNFAGKVDMKLVSTIAKTL